MPIAFVAASTALSDSSGTVTISKPAGVVDGNDMFLYVANDNMSAGTFTPPAGWTIVGAKGYRGVAYYRRASGEPTTYTATISNNDGAVAAIVAYSGTSGTAGRGGGSIQSGSNATSPTPVALTGMLTGDYGVICYAIAALTTPAYTIATPATWTLRATVANTGTALGPATLIVVDKLNGIDQPTTTSNGSPNWSVISAGLAAAALVSPSTFLSFFE